MSEKCKNKIHCFLRPATVADIRELRRLFQDTVLTVNAKDYTPEEVKDWASCGDSTAHWEDLLSRFHFFVALNAGKQIVGFASVNGEGYLHSMFIHKDWQRKGIASALLSEMESYAGGRGSWRNHFRSQHHGTPVFRAAGLHGKERTESPCEPA